MLWRALTPGLRSPRDFIPDFIDRQSRGLRQRRPNPRLAELFSLHIRRFRYTAGEADQHVARPHLHNLLLVAAVLEHSDEHTSATEFLEVSRVIRGAGAEKNRRIMPGVDVSQAPRAL